MSKFSPLTSVSATREVLERHGLATKKSLGQHFLINDGIVGKICDLAQLSETDGVLEVGPGIGTLSLALLEKASYVIAVERDHDLPEVLADTCQEYANRFVLIEKDALDLTCGEVREAKGRVKNLAHNVMPLPNKFVSNLPYAVAATIILDYFERFEFLESATVMIQKEVADRICARPGTKSYGAYTLKLSLFAEPVGQFVVKPANFFPPPRVDSAVVRLDRVETVDEEGSLLGAEVLESTLRMIDAAFTNRRKTILNSCKTYFAAQKSNEKSRSDSNFFLPLFEQAEVDPALRGEVLSKNDFIRLGKAYLKVIQ